MTRANEPESEVARLLAGAARTVKNVPYCWLVTTGAAGDIGARPMGRLLHDAGEDEWRIRFVTDGRSRKMAGLRRQAEVVLVFQHEPSDAYVALTGRAMLRDEPSEVSRRWKAHYDAYFPTESDRASAIFVEVDAERMALWIRGVTPEPFGLQTTCLERRAGGAWRVLP
jgi:general stress protein 26